MRVVGSYELDELLGAGGMGEVWRAVDTEHDGRPVALKLLHPGVSASAEFAARFRREARLAASVRHPNIVPIHRYGEVEGRLFLAMQLVDGVGLNVLLREHGPLGAERAVRVVTQLADALDAAHATGLVHRDVKPGNVQILEPRDFAYLLDFGIASSTEETGLTGEGMGPGTVAYMAPERFGPGAIDPRMDVYSLAALLHACLVGRPPFDTPDLARAAWAHVHEPPPRPSASDPALPAALDAVVARGMAKDPDARYPTAGALAADAARALTGTGPLLASRATPDDARSVSPPTASVTVAGPPPVGPPTPSGPPDAPSPGPRRRGLLIGALAGVAVLVLAGVAVVVALVGTDTGPALRPRPTPVTPAPLAAGASVRVPVGSDPFGLAVSPDGRLVYVVNQRSSSVTVVDATVNQAVATVPTMRSPEQVVLSPDGATVWVTGDDGVQAIDAATRAVRATVPLAGVPGALAIAPDGGRLYVGLVRARDVVELDTATLAFRRTLPTGSANARNIAVSPDGRTLATVSDTDRALTVDDLATGAVRGRLALPDLTPSVPTVTVDNRNVIVPDTKTSSRGLLVVDLTGPSVRTIVPTDGLSANGIALSPDGGTAYAHADGLRGSGTLFAVDTATWQVRGRTLVPAENSNLAAVSPDGSRAYVVDGSGNALVVTALR